MEERSGVARAEGALEVSLRDESKFIEADPELIFSAVGRYNMNIETKFGGAHAEGAKGLPLSGKIKYVMADPQHDPVPHSCSSSQ